MLKICMFRYPIGGRDLPYFTQWVQDVLDVDLNFKNPPRDIPRHHEFPEPTLNPGKELC